MSLTLNSGFTLGPGVVLDANPVIPPTIITDGLVLHYDFSDPACYSGGTTTGTGITDLSTAANNGTIQNDFGAIVGGSDVNGNTFITWQTNAGNSYTGSSIHTASQNTYTDFTIVFQPDLTANGIVGLFAVETDKSVRFTANGSAWQAFNPGDGNDWAYPSPATYYINGQASNSPVAGWNIMGGARTNNSWTMPNGLFIGTSNYVNRHFQGQIALVLMYNRALTQEEQLQNYNVLRARFGL
jgi:hypothetical protein